MIIPSVGKMEILLSRRNVARARDRLELENVESVLSARFKLKSIILGKFSLNGI